MATGKSTCVLKQRVFVLRGVFVVFVRVAESGSVSIGELI